MQYVSWLNLTMSGIFLCLYVCLTVCGPLCVPGLARKPNSISYRLHLPNCTAVQVGSLQRVPSLGAVCCTDFFLLLLFLAWLFALFILVMTWFICSCFICFHAHTLTHTKQSRSRRFFYIFNAVRLGQCRQHFTYMESSHAIIIFKICIKCTFKIYNLPLQSYFRLWCSKSYPISKRTFTIHNCHRQMVPFWNVSRLMKHMKWRQITLTTTELLTGMLH